MNYGYFQIFSPFIFLYTDFNDFYQDTYVKIKFELVDNLNLTLTNPLLYDQHYFAAIPDSPTRFNQTI